MILANPIYMLYYRRLCANAAVFFIAKTLVGQGAIYMFKFNSLIPRLMLNVQGITYGKKLKLTGWPFIYKFKNSKITIGDNVIINSNFWSNLLGNYQRSIIVARDGNVEIGNNVGMSGVTIYSWKRIAIGDGTIIGANVKIVDNDFHPLDAEARKTNDISKVKKKDVIIGKNCFIGMNSIILKGCEIGDDCVVGAGSVVRGGVYPKGSIIFGNPAQIVEKKKDE